MGHCAAVRAVCLRHFHSVEPIVVVVVVVVVE